MIRLGPFDVVCELRDDDEFAMVMFHGYGANAHDLVPLSQTVSSPDNLSWYFPNGILDMSGVIGRGSRAWFPIDLSELERAFAKGEFRKHQIEAPSGLLEARQQAEEFLKTLPFKPAKTILGGFSQGAMLAIDVALHMSENPAGLIILSGNVINSAEWERRAPEHKGLRFFQSHGTSDPLLSFSMAQKLEQLLRSSGLVGSLQTFNGGHEIPLTILQKMNTFLKQLTQS